MTPIQIQPEISESGVDMSPSAILARLEMVGQLNDLCRFLASGTFIPTQDQNAAVGSKDRIEQASCAREIDADTR